MRNIFEMTPDEAKKLKSFQHYCACGEYARRGEHPHKEWCPQYEEHLEWLKAMRELERLIQEQAD